LRRRFARAMPCTASSVEVPRFTGRSRCAEHLFSLFTQPAQSSTVACAFPSFTSRCLLGHRGCAHGRPSLIDGIPMKWRRRKGG
jgi:hypothetical protein